MNVYILDEQKIAEFTAREAKHFNTAGEGEGEEMDNSHDPPAWIRNKLKEEEEREMIRKTAAGESLLSDAEGLYSATGRRRTKILQRRDIRQGLYEDIYHELATSIAESGDVQSDGEHEHEHEHEHSEDIIVTNSISMRKMKSTLGLEETNGVITGNANVDALLREAAEVEKIIGSSGPGWWKNKEKNSSFHNADQWKLIMQKKTEVGTTMKAGDEGVDVEDLDKLLSEEDMNYFILSKEEQKKKSAIWERMHRWSNFQ